MAGQRKRGAGDGRTLVRGAYSRCAIPPLRRRAVLSRAYAFRSLCRDIPNRCRGTTMSVSKAQRGGATDLQPAVAPPGWRSGAMPCEHSQCV